MQGSDSFSKASNHKLVEMLLYRGDSRNIDKFDFAQTDPGALFGRGIYLTSDPDVAHDYTATKSEETLYPRKHTDPNARTVRELLRNYILSLADNFNETSYKKVWMRAHGLDPYAGMPEHLSRELAADMEEAKKENLKNKLPIVATQVRAELPSLRAIKMTTGELRLVKDTRTAAVSVFDVPDEYVARTLHADQPLPDRVIKVLRRLWMDVYPDGNGDLRDANEKFLKFDDYIANYKTRGTRYAWREPGDDDWFRGGRGENPTLDDLMNGTNGGSYAFKSIYYRSGKAETAIVAALEALGYVGLEYDGGKRLATNTGNQVRGGGGRRHRAFVFWDADALQKFRRPNAPLPAGKRATRRSFPTDL